MQRGPTWRSQCFRCVFGDRVGVDLETVLFRALDDGVELFSPLLDDRAVLFLFSVPLLDWASVIGSISSS